MPRGETQHEHVWLDVLRWIAETRDIAISGHQRPRTVALACRGGAGCVLCNLDDGKGLLESVHAPEPAGPMSGLLPQFGHDVLVFLVAVQVRR